MKNILSIQSYVCFGYVGNRAAVFPLQRLGFDVTAVNTVQFSNHTGYEDFSGDVMTPDHLSDVLSGVERRGVYENLEAVLSGYQGDLALGELILKTVQKIKNIRQAKNLPIFYCCDPVIGDVGVGRFVPLELAEFIKNQCVPMADILTPNLYELAYLTGVEVSDFTSIESLKSACHQLHERGPSIILVTSIEGGLLTPSTDQEKNSVIHMLLSVKQKNTNKAYLVSTPKFEFKWPTSGAGDAVAAIFLGNFLKSQDPKLALEKTASAIFEILKATFEAGTRELQLIGAQDSIVSPFHIFPAQEI